MKPLVGIVGTIYDLKTPFTREVEIVNPENTDFVTERVLYNAENFISYFNKVGCHACLISPKDDPEIIEHLDLVVIPGGPDINPAFYGQEPHPKTYFEKDGIRDYFEKTIINLAMERGVPIFAVCRGAQIVNAVLGGTLHQHLPDWSTEVEHRSPKGPSAYTHQVKTSGWLADILGAETNVNSWHHQGIDQLAPSLTPLAWSEEGLVEAYENKTNVSPVFAVQWHPEILQDDLSLELLSEFLNKHFKK